MINKIFFDWYPISKDNEVAFGQISFYNEFDEKLDSHNIDVVCEDLFLLLFELYNQHVKSEDVKLFYDRLF